MADETTSPVALFNNAHHFISVKLTPTNYLFWKTQITLFLKAQNLLGYVDGTHNCPPRTHPNYTQWIQQDQIIMSLLIGSLSEDVFAMVSGLETCHDIWTTLEKALPTPSNHSIPQGTNEGDQSTVTHMDRSLYESARDGDLDALRQNNDPLQVQLTPCKNTLLHVLAQFQDNAECVNEILEMQNPTIKPSMLTWKNSKGETALHIAARKGRQNTVRALIERAKTLDRENLESGAKIAEELIRATDENGDTALHWAVRKRHTQVVSLLVEEDPDFPHPPNKMEETPLYLAVENNDHDTVDSILTKCNSPAYEGPGGRTPLHAAVINNCEDCTSKLLNHMQAWTKESDEFGWSPLHYAARFDFVSRASQLLEADRSAAYIMANKDDNRTPLHVAAWHGNVDVMKALLEHCPDCWEMTTNKGHNVLHLAWVYEKNEVLDFILSKSWAAELINEKDAEGNTPLHFYATSTMLFERVELQHPEGDHFTFNKQNLTALDLIEDFDSNALVEFFRGVGGKNGNRNVIQRDGYDYKTWKKRNPHSSRRRSEEIRRQGDLHLIVATLVATVTFAAGFTVPGGYDGNEGANQGMAVLARKAAFNAFVVSDTIAVMSSIIAVFLHFAASMYEDEHKVKTRQDFAFFLILFSMIAMTVAFMTGLYTVLTPSLGLAITVCFFGSFCILVFILVFLRFIKSSIDEDI